MGGDSKSSSSQESRQTDQAFNFVEGTGDGDRLNLALSEGAEVGDVTYTSTDYGALEKAYELNKQSGDLMLTTAERAFDSANDYAARSFDALDEGYDFTRDINRDSLDFVTSSLDQVLTASADQLQAGRDQTDRQVSAAYDLAQTHSRSEGGEALQGVIKIGMVGAGLFGSALVLREVVKSSKNAKGAK